MSFDKHKFKSDYSHARIIQKYYNLLIKNCWRYENTINKTSPHFDPYGYVKSSRGYISVDEIEPIYFGKAEQVGQYITTIRELTDYIDDPEKMSKFPYEKHSNLMDARYPHVHLAWHCVHHDFDKEQREKYYIDTLTVDKKTMGKSNQYIDVELPKIYHRKVDINFIIRKAEELIEAYGESDIIEETTKRKIVFFTGSGISQESGIPTFRDSDGLWDQYPVDIIASIYGWISDPIFVNDFYNNLRQKYVGYTNGERTINPNLAHELIVNLACEPNITDKEDKSYGRNTTGYNNQIVIITQNVDDLHEQSLINLEKELQKTRKVISTHVDNHDENIQTLSDENCECDCNCGCYDSTIKDDDSDWVFDDTTDKKEEYKPTLPVEIIHLHGKLLEMCADGLKENTNYHITFPYKGSYTLPSDIKVKDIFTNEFGSPIGEKRMRPYVVFFGEDVPNMGIAINEIQTCDICVVIGTSLQVKPAMELLNYIPHGVPVIYIDPNPDTSDVPPNTKIIRKRATEGMEELIRNWNSYVR